MAQTLSSKYTIEYEKGFDSLGSISVVRENSSNVKRTCKTIPKWKYDVDFTDVQRKLGLLKQLRHPNICSLLEVLDDGEHFYLIYERAEGGDLQDLWERMTLSDNWLDERAVAAYIQGICVALAYCHSSGIVHRDLCPATVLLSTALPDAIVKLADVGLSSVFDPEHERQMQPSSFSAPELTDRTGAFLTAMAVDMWAVGALAYRLLINKDIDEQGSASRVRFYEEDGWAERSPSSRNFVRKTLTPLGKRSTSAQALMDPWLRRYAIPVPGPRQRAPLPPREDPRYLVVSCLLLQAPRHLSIEELDQAHSTFVSLDADGDGLISRGELGVHLSEQYKTTEQFVGRIMEFVDMRKVGVLDFCAFLVAVMATKEKGLDPIQIAKSLFKSFGPNDKVNLQQLAAALPVPALRQIEIYARVKYMILLQALPVNRAVSCDEFINFLQVHAANGSSFAPLDDEEDEDELDSIHDSVFTRLGEAFTFEFKLCNLCTPKSRRR